MFYFDQYYLLLVVPALILSAIAQLTVKSTFAKYSKIANRRGLTGADAAASMLRVNGIRDVSVAPVGGQLTDHYDPSSKTLRLSGPVYGERSIAAVGVAAHEAGHALQHAASFGPLVLRSTLVPAANIGSAFGPYVAIAGIFFGMPLLINAGIVLFAAAVVFYLVTLPVEFDASRRALAHLERGAMLTSEELSGARKVLTAAALTYVASALTALASLARLLLLARDRRD